MNQQTPPYSQEAEEAVIGSVLVDPSILPVLAAFLKPDDFFLTRHGVIWQSLIRLDGREFAIDYLTVCDELKAMGQLEHVGGPAYLTQLITSTPTSRHAEVYAQLVEVASIRRRLMSAADQIKIAATNEELTTDEVMAEVEQLLGPMRARTAGGKQITLADGLSEYLATIERMIETRQQVSGIPSGLHHLDNLLGGWQKNDLVIVAGRPGSGKTSFALGAALAAAEAGKRVGIISMEMSIDQLVRRFITMETHIKYGEHANGLLNPANFRNVLKAAGHYVTLDDRLFISDRSRQTPASVRAEALRWTNQRGLDLLVVDYLQLMSGGGRFNTRNEEVAHISTAMKHLARELRIPVMALAQLSRAVENRADKRPVLSDLRDSGQLEQDADIVIFLYRDAMYNEAAYDPHAAEINVAKHRNGSVGKVHALYPPHVMRFQTGIQRSVRLYENTQDEETVDA